MTYILCILLGRKSTHINLAATLNFLSIYYFYPLAVTVAIYVNENLYIEASRTCTFMYFLPLFLQNDAMSTYIFSWGKPIKKLLNLLTALPIEWKYFLNLMFKKPVKLSSTFMLFLKLQRQTIIIKNVLV